jgi:hypothetical protein
MRCGSAMPTDARRARSAACTCARLSGDPGSYPCPVHPEMGAATVAGPVVRTDSAAHTEVAEVCPNCGDTGMFYEPYLAEWVPCRVCRPDDWEAEHRGR